MKTPSQEDLLGYVLGALDAPEQREIQQLIDQNPELEEQLLRIKAALAPLDELDGGGPRPGLARRTCETVANRDKENADFPEVVFSKSANLDSAISAAIASADLNVQTAEVTPAPRTFSSFRDRLTSPSSWAMTDVLVGVALMAIMAGILFPTISYQRFNSRVVACQDNLRQVGTALMDYSDINDGTFVVIPQSGNLSASGCYAPILKDSGLIEDDNVFSCAGIAANQPPVHIPSCKQINCRSITDQQLNYLRRTMGGHFGYTMGFRENDRYCPPRPGRINIVILADQPSMDLAGRRSANHGGDGQNCLFADGRVCYIKGHTIAGDALFENDYGIVAPGSHAWDNVIAASHLSIQAEIVTNGNQ